MCERHRLPALQILTPDGRTCQVNLGAYGESCHLWIWRRLRPTSSRLLHPVASPCAMLRPTHPGSNKLASVLPSAWKGVNRHRLQSGVLAWKSAWGLQRVGLKP